jgi:hypothetical protein
MVPIRMTFKIRFRSSVMNMPKQNPVPLWNSLESVPHDHKREKISRGQALNSNAAGVRER